MRHVEIGVFHRNHRVISQVIRRRGSAPWQPSGSRRLDFISCKVHISEIFPRSVIVLPRARPFATPLRGEGRRERGRESISLTAARSKIAVFKSGTMYLAEE